MKRMWINKKFVHEFQGSYERDKKGERIFVLNGRTGRTGMERRRITFESWQAAVKNGWRKIR